LKYCYNKKLKQKFDIILAQIIVISWILGLGIIGINVYYLITAFVGWLIHSTLPKVANVFIGIIVFPLMALYVVSVIYLTFRKDTVKTFVEVKDDPAMQTHVEKGFVNDGQVELSYAPYREDLADIALPEGPRL
jgi:natural resistance-associated macrophage protein